jgi:hypothetical protein
VENNAHEIITEVSDADRQVKAVYEFDTHQMRLTLLQDGEEHTFDLEILEIMDEQNAKLRIIDEHGESMLMGLGTFESKIRNKRAIPILLAAIAGTVGRQAVTQILNRMIQAGIMLYIGDQAFARVTEIRDELRKNKKYDHYQARIINNDVYIGKGLTESEAVVHLQTADYLGGVWSVDRHKAKRLATIAGGGKQPESKKYPHGEIHCDRITGSYAGYYPHFHINGHIGGHSWY